MKMRLQKFIANAGYCSRRKAEELIKEQKVLVDEKTAKIGDVVESAINVVKIGNRIIATKKANNVYIALNKPTGYICSSTSKQGETVLDLISSQDKKRARRLYCVGRLDKNSSGLVLLTNDGEITNKLTHPRFEHEKKYEVTINKQIATEDRATLEKGMKIDGNKLLGIKIFSTQKVQKNFRITIILKEGKNRQIRKMFGKLGYNIISLKRISIGKIQLGNLKLGKYKYIDRVE